MSQAPAWPTLRARLSLMGLAGDHPVPALRQAVSAREVDTAADPAALLDWRLDDAGLRGIHAGPLPWVPGVPDTFATHPTWGPYLNARAQRVSDLAQEVAHAAVTGPTPAWAAEGSARPVDDVLARVAVWRAAAQVEDTDLRPTGPPQPSRAAATHQAILRSQLQGDRALALLEFGPLLEEVAPEARDDSFAPVLAERLAAASVPGSTSLCCSGGPPRPDRCPTTTLPLRCGGASPTD